MKKCSKCQEQDLGKFTEKNKSSYCRACQKEYAAEHYKNNKDKYTETRIKNKPRQKREKRDFIEHYKSTTPCVDCKKCFPYYLMEFDHLDGYLKKEKLSRLLSSNYALSILLAEMAKCELLCRNCHRDRTYQRLLVKGFNTTRGAVLYTQDYKQGRACYNCNIVFNYWILDFDHKPGTIKSGNIGEMIWRCSLEKIKAEIEKCDCVCANCHAARTYNRIKEVLKVPLNGGQYGLNP